MQNIKCTRLFSFSCAVITIALLCSHHQHKVQNIFQISKLSLCPHWTMTPCSLFSQPLGTTVTLPVSDSDYCRHLIEVYHTAFVLRNWLICLSISSSGLSILSHVFLERLNNIPLYRRPVFCFPIYLFLDTWVASMFWLLWVTLLCTWVYT